MTYQNNFTIPTEILEQITSSGMEGLPEMVRIIFNEAMRQERNKYLAADPYERELKTEKGTLMDLKRKK